jgi:hypothetical protein
MAARSGLVGAAAMLPRTPASLPKRLAAAPIPHCRQVRGGSVTAGTILPERCCVCASSATVSGALRSPRGGAFARRASLRHVSGGLALEVGVARQRQPAQPPLSVTQRGPCKRTIMCAGSQIGSQVCYFDARCHRRRSSFPLHRFGRRAPAFGGPAAVAETDGCHSARFVCTTCRAAGFWTGPLENTQWHRQH